VPARLRAPLTTVLVVSFIALGPLSTDMYLPALPAMTRYFDVGIDRMQLTLSVYLVGFAIAHLFFGPLSDRYGRKPVLAGGLACYSAASVGCALSSSIEVLVLCRFFQAAGASAGTVIGRTMVHDIYGPLDSARMLSYIASAMALGPMVAPLAGGYLAIAFGWPAIFWVLGIFCTTALIGYAVAVPESLTRKNRDATRWRGLAINYRALLRDRGYIGYTLCVALVYSGLFAFLSGASYVLIDYFGVASQHFGWWFMAVVAAYVVSTVAAGRLHWRFGTPRLVVAGAGVNLAGALLMLALAIADVRHPLAVVGPQMVSMLGVGLVLPQSLAGAMAPFPRIAGTASAVTGFVQMTLAALVGIAVGELHDGSPLAMAVAIAATAALTLLVARRTLR